TGRAEREVLAARRTTGSGSGFLVTVSSGVLNDHEASADTVTTGDVASAARASAVRADTATEGSAVAAPSVGAAEAGIVMDITSPPEAATTAERRPTTARLPVAAAARSSRGVRGRRAARCLARWGLTVTRYLSERLRGELSGSGGRSPGLDHIDLRCSLGFTPRTPSPVPVFVVPPLLPASRTNPRRWQDSAIRPRAPTEEGSVEQGDSTRRIRRMSRSGHDVGARGR